MTTPPLRVAARVIAQDDDGRVLLLRYDENGGFWATPGGSLTTGEDHIAAVRRELGEELGVDVDRVELGPQLAERRSEHKVGGRDVRQVERYYLTRLTSTDLDPARATRPDNIQEHRWWTLAELRATPTTIYPIGLSDLITEILSAGVPKQPAVLW